MKARPSTAVSRAAFTLIEVLVVVAIIALLVAILIPSLQKARENARASVCAGRMREITRAGVMWLEDAKMQRAPAHRGWAPYVMKSMSGATEPFHCPSAGKDAIPLPAVLVSQHRTGETYPTLATDSAYFRRQVINSGSSGSVWRIDMETEADVGGGDRDFNDAYVFYQADSHLSDTGFVWARREGTGRELKLHNWRGKTLADMPQGVDTPKFEVPILWGGFGMNLSAALPGAENFHVLYLDYSDWSAVVERDLGVMDELGRQRVDDPRQMGAFRHNGRANVSFLDTHIERMIPDQLALPADPLSGSIWHPQRPPGWTPPKLDP